MTDDQIHDMLSELAGLDTYDVNLGDNPKAYEIVSAYAEAAIKQEREAANRDVERYRIVREGRSWEFMVNCVPDGRETFTPEGLDDACDRALRARSEPHPPWCSGGCCDRSEGAK